ncbi:MAG: Lsr2 family protein [Mycobacterium sp.]|jgi:hypothetical protein|nr:Lsr2 family protein [Mycobacterium sp.]
MKITVDSSESLDDVLRVVGAAYGVNVGVVESDGAMVAERPSSTRRPRRAGRTQRASAAARPRRRRAGASSASSADVRAWAREHGHTVSDRGRLPAPILEAYRAASS